MSTHNTTATSRLRLPKSTSILLGHLPEAYFSLAACCHTFRRSPARAPHIPSVKNLKQAPEMQRRGVEYEKRYLQKPLHIQSNEASISLSNITKSPPPDEKDMASGSNDSRRSAIEQDETELLGIRTLISA